MAKPSDEIIDAYKKMVLTGKNPYSPADKRYQQVQDYYKLMGQHGDYGYKPAPAINDAKAMLAGASFFPLATIPATLAGITGDLYTGTRYMMDEQYKEGLKDYAQAALGFLPTTWAKKVAGINLSKKPLTKNLRAVQASQKLADISDIVEMQEEGEDNSKRQPIVKVGTAKDLRPVPIVKFKDGGTVMPGKTSTPNVTFKGGKAGQYANYSKYDDAAEYDYYLNYMRDALKARNPEQFGAYANDLRQANAQGMRSVYTNTDVASRYNVPALTDEDIRKTFAGVQSVNNQDPYTRFMQLYKQHNPIGGLDNAPRTDYSTFGLKDLSTPHAASWGSNTGGYYRPYVKDGNLVVDANINPEYTPPPSFGGDFSGYNGVVIPKGLGKMAMGGVVTRPVELEGGEFAVTPQGTQVGFDDDAPSHEQGGIPIPNMPVGSRVFSKKIKLDGVSMADRAERRGRREKRIADLLKDDGQDMIGKKTLSRVRRANKQQEEMDMMYQDAVGGGQPQFRNGGTVPKYVVGTSGIRPDQFQQMQDAFGAEDEDPYQSLTFGDYSRQGVVPTWERPDLSPKPITSNFSAFNKLANSKPTTLATETAKPGEEGGGWKENMGNIAGYTGLAMNIATPILSTIANAKRNKTNVNRWKGYGADAMDRNAAAEDAINFAQNEANINNSISRNTQAMAADNSSRSLNVGRAMRSMIDYRADQGEQGIASNFAGHRANVIGERARLSMERDMRERMGQDVTDTENAQDIDAYFSNLNKDMGNIGTGLQTLGRNMNQDRLNRDQMEMMKYMGKYGEYPELDPKTGRIKIRTT